MSAVVNGLINHSFIWEKRYQVQHYSHSLYKDVSEQQAKCQENTVEMNTICVFVLIIT